MSNNTLTIEQLHEKIGGNLWTKGNMKRIYLDRGYNTKKMTTKTFIYQHEDGGFGVSCYIDCPSQPFQWIKSQQDEIIKGVQQEIKEALSETVYILTNKEGKPVNWRGGEVTLNFSTYYFTEMQAKEEVENTAAFYSYVTMPRNEFEVEIKRLELIDEAERMQKEEQQKSEQGKTASGIDNDAAINEYGIGSFVNHAKFGKGEVVDETNNIVTIIFPEGKKQLMKKFVKLEKIESND